MRVRAGFPGDPRVHLQRIDVEESLPVKLHSCEDGVIECKLHDVRVFAVYLVFEHSFREEHQPDGSAGFAVCRVRGQVVIHRECLSHAGRADSAGDVHFAVDDILPQPPTCREKLPVARFGGEVGHSGVKIHRPDRVPGGFGLLAHRLRALPVVVAPGVASPDCPVALFGFLCKKRRVLAALVYEHFRKL